MPCAPAVHGRDPQPATIQMEIVSDGVPNMAEIWERRDLAVVLDQAVFPDESLGCTQQPTTYSARSWQARTNAAKSRRLTSSVCSSSSG
jgi:hypothetical protein